MFLGVAKITALLYFSGDNPDTYQICIRSRCPVDRVFRNCGVRNSEVILYLVLIINVEKA